MSRLKLLQMALITFGIVFCLVYPLAIVWPSGWAMPVAPDRRQVDPLAVPNDLTTYNRRTWIGHYPGRTPAAICRASRPTSSDGKRQYCGPWFVPA